MAWPADGLRPADARDGFGGSVKGSDAPIKVDREHPFSYAVQDQLMMTLP
jgi:hypothetical protein